MAVDTTAAVAAKSLPEAAGPETAGDQRQNMLGIGLLVLGVGLFSLQDIIVKALSGAYPVGEVILIRSVVSLPLLLILLMVLTKDRKLTTRRPLLHLVRSLMLLVAYVAYYLALAAMPLAETVAIAFAAPLFITMISALFLAERVGIRRWAGVAVGFIGVLLITRPGAATFEPAALFAVLCALSYASAQVLARVLGREDGAVAMAIYASVAYLVASLGLGLLFSDGHLAAGAHPSIAFLVRAWVWPSPLHLAMMAATGVIAALGMLALTKAYSVGEASVVTPFEYTGMLWATLWGVLIWNEWPTAWALAGSALLVLSGLYILMRERVRGRPLLSVRGRLRLRSGL